MIGLRLVRFVLTDGVFVYVENCLVRLSCRHYSKGEFECVGTARVTIGSL